MAINAGIQSFLLDSSLTVDSEPRSLYERMYNDSFGSMSIAESFGSRAYNLSSSLMFLLNRRQAYFDQYVNSYKFRRPKRVQRSLNPLRSIISSSRGVANMFGMNPLNMLAEEFSGIYYNKGIRSLVDPALDAIESRQSDISTILSNRVLRSRPDIARTPMAPFFATNPFGSAIETLRTSSKDLSDRGVIFAYNLLSRLQANPTARRVAAGLFYTAIIAPPAIHIGLSLFQSRYEEGLTFRKAISAASAVSTAVFTGLAAFPRQGTSSASAVMGILSSLVVHGIANNNSDDLIMGFIPSETAQLAIYAAVGYGLAKLPNLISRAIQQRATAIAANRTLQAAALSSPSTTVKPPIVSPDLFDNKFGRVITIGGEYTLPIANATISMLSLMELDDLDRYIQYRQTYKDAVATALTPILTYTVSAITRGPLLLSLLLGAYGADKIADSIADPLASSAYRGNRTAPQIAVGSMFALSLLSERLFRAVSFEGRNTLRESLIALRKTYDLESIRRQQAAVIASTSTIKPSIAKLVITDLTGGNINIGYLFSQGAELTAPTTPGLHLGTRFRNLYTDIKGRFERAGMPLDKAIPLVQATIIHSYVSYANSLAFELNYKRSTREKYAQTAKAMSRAYGMGIGSSIAPILNMGLGWSIGGAILGLFVGEFAKDLIQKRLEELTDKEGEYIYTSGPSFLYKMLARYGFERYSSSGPQPSLPPVSPQPSSSSTSPQAQSVETNFVDPQINTDSTAPTARRTASTDSIGRLFNADDMNRFFGIGPITLYSKKKDKGYKKTPNPFNAPVMQRLRVLTDYPNLAAGDETPITKVLSEPIRMLPYPQEPGYVLPDISTNFLKYLSLKSRKPQLTRLSGMIPVSEIESGMLSKRTKRIISKEFGVRLSNTNEPVKSVLLSIFREYGATDQEAVFGYMLAVPPNNTRVVNDEASLLDQGNSIYYKSCQASDPRAAWFLNGGHGTAYKADEDVISAKQGYLFMWVSGQPMSQDGKGYTARAKLRLIYDSLLKVMGPPQKPKALYVDVIYGSQNILISDFNKLKSWWTDYSSQKGWGEDIPIYTLSNNPLTKKEIYVSPSNLRGYSDTIGSLGLHRFENILDKFRVINKIIYQERPKVYHYDLATGRSSVTYLRAMKEGEYDDVNNLITFRDVSFREARDERVVKATAAAYDFMFRLFAPPELQGTTKYSDVLKLKVTSKNTNTSYTWVDHTIDFKNVSAPDSFAASYAFNFSEKQYYLESKHDPDTNNFDSIRIIRKNSDSKIDFEYDRTKGKTIIKGAAIELGMYQAVPIAAGVQFNIDRERARYKRGFQEYLSRQILIGHQRNAYQQRFNYIQSMLDAHRAGYMDMAEKKMVRLLSFGDKLEFQHNLKMMERAYVDAQSIDYKYYAGNHSLAELLQLHFEAFMLKLTDYISSDKALLSKSESIYKRVAKASFGYEIPGFSNKPSNITMFSTSRRGGTGQSSASSSTNYLKQHYESLLKSVLPGASLDDIDTTYNKIINWLNTLPEDDPRHSKLKQGAIYIEKYVLYSGEYKGTVFETIDSASTIIGKFADSIDFTSDVKMRVEDIRPHIDKRIIDVYNQSMELEEETRYWSRGIRVNKSRYDYEVADVYNDLIDDVLKLSGTQETHETVRAKGLFPELEIKDMDGFAGGYVFKERKVRLSTIYSYGTPEGIITTAHELRHYAQYNTGAIQEIESVDSLSKVLIPLYHPNVLRHLGYKQSDIDDIVSKGQRSIQLITLVGLRDHTFKEASERTRISQVLEFDAYAFELLLREYFLNRYIRGAQFEEGETLYSTKSTKHSTRPTTMFSTSRRKEFYDFSDLDQGFVSTDTPEEIAMYNKIVLKQGGGSSSNLTAAAKRGQSTSRTNTSYLKQHYESLLKSVLPGASLDDIDYVYNKVINGLKTVSQDDPRYPKLRQAAIYIEKYVLYSGEYKGTVFETMGPGSTIIGDDTDFANDLKMRLEDIRPSSGNRMIDIHNYSMELVEEAKYWSRGVKVNKSIHDYEVADVYSHLIDDVLKLSGINETHETVRAKGLFPELEIKDMDGLAGGYVYEEVKVRLGTLHSKGTPEGITTTMHELRHYAQHNTGAIRKIEDVDYLRNVSTALYDPIVLRALGYNESFINDIISRGQRSIQSAIRISLKKHGFKEASERARISQVLEFDAYAFELLFRDYFVDRYIRDAEFKDEQPLTLFSTSRKEFYDFSDLDVGFTSTVSLQDIEFYGVTVGKNSTYYDMLNEYHNMNLSKYEKLGSGGSGIVYKTDRGTALKVFSYKELGEAEITNLQRVLGSKVAPTFIHSYVIDGKLAVEMELVQGKTLQEELRKLTVEQKQRYASLVREAMDDLAKNYGVIHSDLGNPENIIITGDGKVKFVDFGAVAEYTSQKDLDDEFAYFRDYVLNLRNEVKASRLTTSVDPITSVKSYRQLGRGGEGAVYLTHRNTALKVYEIDRLGQNEINNLMLFKGSGIAPEYIATHTVDGKLAVEMELIEGVSLDKVIDSYTKSQKDSLTLRIRGLLETMAKKYGKVHGDLSNPENIFITKNNEIRLLDFGTLLDYRDERDIEDAMLSFRENVLGEIDFDSMYSTSRPSYVGLDYTVLVSSKQQQLDLIEDLKRRVGSFTDVYIHDDEFWNDNGEIRRGLYNTSEGGKNLPEKFRARGIHVFSTEQERPFVFAHEYTHAIQHSLGMLKDDMSQEFRDYLEMQADFIAANYVSDKPLYMDVLQNRSIRFYQQYRQEIIDTIIEKKGKPLHSTVGSTYANVDTALSNSYRQMNETIRAVYNSPDNIRPSDVNVQPTGNIFSDFLDRAKAIREEIKNRRLNFVDNMSLNVDYDKGFFSFEMYASNTAMYADARIRLYNSTSDGGFINRVMGRVSARQKQAHANRALMVSTLAHEYRMVSQIPDDALKAQAKARLIEAHRALDPNRRLWDNAAMLTAGLILPAISLGTSIYSLHQGERDVTFEDYVGAAALPGLFATIQVANFEPIRANVDILFQSVLEEYAIKRGGIDKLPEITNELNVNLSRLNKSTLGLATLAATIYTINSYAKGEGDPMATGFTAIALGYWASKAFPETTAGILGRVSSIEGLGDIGLTMLSDGYLGTALNLLSAYSTVSQTMSLTSLYGEADYYSKVFISGQMSQTLSSYMGGIAAFSGGLGGIGEFTYGMYFGFGQLVNLPFSNYMAKYGELLPGLQTMRNDGGSGILAMNLQASRVNNVATHNVSMGIIELAKRYTPQSVKQSIEAAKLAQSKRAADFMAKLAEASGTKQINFSAVNQINEIIPLVNIAVDTAVIGASIHELASLPKYSTFSRYEAETYHRKATKAHARIGVSAASLTTTGVAFAKGGAAMAGKSMVNLVGTGPGAIAALALLGIQFVYESFLSDKVANNFGTGVDNVISGSIGGAGYGLAGGALLATLAGVTAAAALPFILGGIAIGAVIGGTAAGISHLHNQHRINENAKREASVFRTSSRQPASIDQTRASVKRRSDFNEYAAGSVTKAQQNDGSDMLSTLLRVVNIFGGEPAHAATLNGTVTSSVTDFVIKGEAPRATVYFTDPFRDKKDNSRDWRESVVKWVVDTTDSVRRLASQAVQSAASIFTPGISSSYAHAGVGEAFYSNLRTGPRGRIGAGTEWHVDFKLKQSMPMAQKIAIIDSKAELYAKDGVQMMFINNAAYGIRWDPNWSYDKKAEMVSFLASQHSHRFSPGYDSIDYVIGNVDGRAKSEEYHKISLPYIENTKVIFAKSSDYGLAAYYYNLDTNEKVFTIGHGFDGDAIPEPIIMPKLQRTAPTTVDSTTPKGREELLRTVAIQSGIKDHTELAQFMGQMHHESGGFVYMEEIWGNTKQQLTYENRSDLGNKGGGDGYRYRGRGFTQLTGRANYEYYGKLLGYDLVNNPDLAADPKIASEIAVAYWNTRVKPFTKDFSDTSVPTRLISGSSSSHIDRRKALFKQYLDKTDLTLLPAQLPESRSEQDNLGSISQLQQSGPAVIKEGLPKGGVVGVAERVKADTEGASAIIEAASRLQLDPIELTALMSFESGGTLNPNVIGGDKNLYKGMIQFSPDNQKTYGTGAQQTIAQQMPAVEKYLLDRGFKPGEHDIRHAYSSVLTGYADGYVTFKGGKKVHRFDLRDSNNTRVRDAYRYFQEGPHYERALQFLRDSGYVKGEKPPQPEAQKISAVDMNTASNKGVILSEVELQMIKEYQQQAQVVAAAAPKNIKVTPVDAGEMDKTILLAQGIPDTINLGNKYSPAIGQGVGVQVEDNLEDIERQLATGSRSTYDAFLLAMA